MDCGVIQKELVPFHFGDVTVETRSSVEAHLLACSKCLTDYVSLKREIETNQSVPDPSADLRRNLRRAVALELGVERKPWAWWERPLAFASAAAVIALAVVSLHTMEPRGGRASPSEAGVQGAN